MEVLRTPDDRFTSLPGCPWEPRYAEVPHPVFQRVVPGDRDRAHPTLRGGGHFLQEDVGPQLGRVVADLVAATPRP